MPNNNAPQRKQVIHTVLYSLVLAVVCASILTGVGLAIRPLRDSNEKADMYRNILGVLRVPFEPGATSQELVAIFDKNVRRTEPKQGKWAGLQLYEYVPSGETRPRAVAVPFQGQGLWGPIKGFLATDPQFTRILTISFYDQAETPGLGGDIDTDSFCRRFEGKLLVGQTGVPGIRLVRPGSARADNDVDAISGATLTCGKVEAMLNDVIRRVIEAREDHEQKR